MKIKLRLSAICATFLLINSIPSSYSAIVKSHFVAYSADPYFSVLPANKYDNNALKMEYNTQDKDCKIFVFKIKSDFYQINYLDNTLYSIFLNEKEVPKADYQKHESLIKAQWVKFEKQQKAQQSKMK